MNDEGIAAAAEAVGKFHDRLIEDGFSGAQSEKITEQAAHVIVSYVLFGFTTAAH